MIISSACSNKNNENNYNKANPIIDYDKSSIFVDNSQTSSAILNEETEPIDPIIFDSYDKIYDFYEERAIVKNNDKYGIIDTQGNLVIPTEYDQIDHYIDGLAMVYI